MPHIAATTNDTCSTRSPLLSLSLLSNNHIGYSHSHIASVTSIVHQELPSPSRLNRRSSTCDPFFHPKCIHLWCHPAKNGHTSKLRYVACLIYNSDPNALNPSTKRSFSSSSLSSPPSPLPLPPIEQWKASIVELRNHVVSKLYETLLKD